MGFSVKTIVLVGIYNQQFQGTIILTHLANGPWKKKFELYFPY